MGGIYLLKSKKEGFYGVDEYGDMGNSRWVETAEMAKHLVNGDAHLLESTPKFKEKQVWPKIWINGTDIKAGFFVQNSKDGKILYAWHESEPFPRYIIMLDGKGQFFDYKGMYIVNKKANFEGKDAQARLDELFKELRVN